MRTLSLGIVSDEISPDFREAVRYGLSWGITQYELRCLKTGRVPSVEPSEMQEVLDHVKAHNIRITALSPGVFKHPLSKMEAIKWELTEVLPKTISMAKQCGAPLIIVFGFLREPEGASSQYSEAVEIMRRAAALASKGDVRLAIENEPGFWCDNGKNTAQLIRDVNSPVLGANWDPCNSYGTDEPPYPDGYRAIKESIFNVHVKDTKKGSLIQCVPVGDGVIDWKGQIGALVRDSIVDHITIETHCLPLIENSKRNVDTLRSLLNQAARQGA